MPWEKDFDEEEAVERALAVFWAKGYEGASLQLLATAMQINKSSLYNAFGSKNELFTRSLLKYDREVRRAMLDSLESMDDPLKAIYLMFDSAIDESRKDPDSKGCLLINTAFELPQHSEETRVFVAAGLLDIELFFKGLIERAQARRQISHDLNSAETAQWLLAQFVGLRVLGRGALTPKKLQTARGMVHRQLTALL
jgi:TetR/AcrR family transcriptional regulator, transcriptional repressor for nem operon